VKVVALHCVVSCTQASLTTFELEELHKEDVGNGLRERPGLLANPAFDGVKTSDPALPSALDLVGHNCCASDAALRQIATATLTVAMAVFL
jgi:hypothetical protein